MVRETIWQKNSSELFGYLNWLSNGGENTVGSLEPMYYSDF